VTPITLYSKQGCHLCDEALALLTNLPNNLTVNVIDIVQETALTERYGKTIPVVQFGTGEELAWPFNAEQISAYL